MAASGSSLKIRQYVYKDPNTRNRHIKPNEKKVGTKQNSPAEKTKSAKRARTSVLPRANSPRAAMSSNRSLVSSLHAQGHDAKWQSGPSWWHEHERGAKKQKIMKASSLHIPQEAYQPPTRENVETRTSIPQTTCIPQLPGLAPDYYLNRFPNTEYVRLTRDNLKQFPQWLLKPQQLSEGGQSQCVEPTEEFRDLNVETRGLRLLLNQPTKLEQRSINHIENPSSIPIPGLQVPSESMDNSQPSTSIPRSFSSTFLMSRTKVHATCPRVVDGSPVSPHSASYTGNLVWLPPIMPVPKRKHGQEEAKELGTLGTEISPYSSHSKSDPRRTKRQRVDARALRKTTLPRGNLPSGAATSNHPSSSSPTTTEESVRLSNTSTAEEKPRDDSTLSAGIHHRLFKRKRDRVEDEDIDVQSTELFDQGRRITPNLGMISLVPPENYPEEESPLSSSQHVSSSLGSARGYPSHDDTSVSFYMYDPFFVSRGNQPQAGLSKDLKRKCDMEVMHDPGPSSREPPTKRRGRRAKVRPKDMLQALSTKVPRYSKLASNFPCPSPVVRTDCESPETTLPWTTLVKRDGLLTIDPLPPDITEYTGLGSYTTVASQTEVQPQDKVIAPNLAETPREQDLSDHSLEWSYWKEKLDDLFREPNIDIGHHEEVSEEDSLRFLGDLDMYSSLQVLFPVGAGF